ncbi:MAG: putative bifunctional diguanylate cyclase/phosphodiesterase [Pseudomonadota bacterium]
MTSARERGQQQQGESLTSRITSINMMATGVAVLLACVILVGIESLFLRGSMLDDLRVQASIIGDNEAAPLVFGDGEAARKILHTLGASPAILEADLLAANGIPLATYRQPGWESGGNGGEEALSAFLLPPFVDIEQPIDLDGQQIGTLRLRASMRPLYRRLLVYAGSTLAIALGVMLGAFLLVSRMRRNVVHAEQRLRFLAHTDPVTRLPNRHAFNERLALAVQEAELSGESLALLMLDLDDFKLVNDSFGHPSGDVLLAEVARRLEKGLRHTDFVCRLGGDEFAVLVADPEVPGAAVHVARKILDILTTAPFLVGSEEVFASTSVGVSFFPQDAEDAHELIRNADAALYAAKARGKRTFELFSPGMNLCARERLNLEAHLRRALEHEEFVLHYQPQIEIDTGRVVGVEALVRWNSAERGMVPPNEFIPLAEESGLIVPLGEWVLRTACAQAAAWRAMGLPPLCMAVNLSARQLDGDGLERLVADVLAQTGMSPEWLELEITESALMRDAQANAELLERISSLAVRLSVDDFGTGYSSMAYLKRFPLSKLKIDRSFVTDLTTHADDRAIVSAIIAMAHTLGMQVIAEGVETEGQRDALLAMDCDLLQGYLCSRPLPAEAIPRLLAAGCVPAWAVSGSPAAPA